MNLIKKISFCAALAGTLAIACHKNQNAGMTGNKINSTSPDHASSSLPSVMPQPFSKSVGRFFPADTIKSWVNRYNDLYGAETMPCLFSVADLKSVLHGQPDNYGIMFYNADFKSSWNLIAIPVNSAGALVKTDSVITSSGTVSWQKAMSLKDAFENSHPQGTILGEFFGGNILDSLFSFKDIQIIRIRKAINTDGLRFTLTSSTDDTGAEQGTPSPPFKVS